MIIYSIGTASDLELPANMPLPSSAVSPLAAINIHRARRRKPSKLKKATDRSDDEDDESPSDEARKSDPTQSNLLSGKLVWDFIFCPR